MTKKFLIIFSVFLGLCFSFTSNAQLLQRGRTEAKYNVIQGNYNFWIYTPADYDGIHRFPLIIFLHGRSLSGYDLNRVKRYGVLDAIAKGKIVPALVVAPQTHNGWDPDKINTLLEWVEKNYQVDQTRVYVIGMSMGAYGTLDFCDRYPDKVAAAMAFCGGCSYKEPANLAKIPLWIMHGTADRAVPLSCSKRVVQFLQSQGDAHLLRYDWMQGGTHGTYARMFYLQKTYDWLFSHTTADHPLKVDRSFDITRQDLQQTYNELKWFRDMFEDD